MLFNEKKLFVIFQFHYRKMRQMQSCETDAEPSRLIPQFSITIMGDHDRNENFVFFRKFLFTFQRSSLQKQCIFLQQAFIVSTRFVMSDLSSVPK